MQHRQSRWDESYTEPCPAGLRVHTKAMQMPAVGGETRKGFVREDAPSLNYSTDSCYLLAGLPIWPGQWACISSLIQQRFAIQAGSIRYK